MAVYKNTNVDHPMDQLEKTVADLVAKVQNLEQQITEPHPPMMQAQPLPTTIEEKYPDPVRHKYISFAKSAVRIAAGLFLVWPGSLVLAGVFLIVAEVLGVVEEVV